MEFKTFTQYWNEGSETYLIEAVSIDDQFKIVKLGMDGNGNKSVWVSKDKGRAFKIQTNGNLPITHSNAVGVSWFAQKDDKRVKDAVKEIQKYISKYKDKVMTESEVYEETWVKRLKQNYKKLEYLKAYDDMYGILSRANASAKKQGMPGWKNLKEFWDANPKLTGSTDPKDFGVVPEKVKTESEVLSEAKLPKKVTVVLDGYVGKAMTWDDLPKSVQEALTKMHDHETLWQDAQRYLSDAKTKK